jgi:aspartyl-tRNA(Asn)/glutamyl-tRNA(Gln) amidotransferase subunit A
VLVIEHRRLRTWLPIGGELEPGETPLEAAARELREETGLAGEFRPLRGALDGVPATVKDLMPMRGFPTRRGSRLFANAPPDGEDAPAVARLREADAVILGKTTAPEFGWKGLGDSPLTGVTRNPWNRARTPGGSSAGAAAACAAGIAPLHLGSDGGGSIRIPAAFCGIFGLKGSFGRVPFYPPGPLASLSSVGPMARDVRDAALLLNVMARPDARDPYALPPDDRDYRDGLDDGVAGLRIACSRDLGYARVDPEIAAATKAAARQFAELGAQVEEVPGVFPSPRETLLTIWRAGMARLLSGFPRERLGECDPGLVAVAREGEQVSGADVIGADIDRAVLARHMSQFHQRFDLLLTPTMPVPALPVGQDLNDPATETNWVDWSPFSYPFNLTRQPAASVPCGLTAAGLPIGLQIVGPLYGDRRVLCAARAFEQTQPRRRPADRGLAAAEAGPAG